MTFQFPMKKISFLFIALLVLSSGFIAAQSLDNFTFKQIECTTILPFKDRIIGQEISEDIPISNEIVNVYISNEIYGFVEIEEKQLTNIDCFENESATYNLFIESESTLSDIASSEDIFDEFVRKFKDKEIQLKGNTFSKKFNAFFFKIGIKWFF